MHILKFMLIEKSSHCLLCKFILDNRHEIDISGQHCKDWLEKHSKSMEQVIFIHIANVFLPQTKKVPLLALHFCPVNPCTLSSWPLFPPKKTTFFCYLSRAKTDYHTFGFFRVYWMLALPPFQLMRTTQYISIPIQLTVGGSQIIN